MNKEEMILENFKERMERKIKWLKNLNQGKGEVVDHSTAVAFVMEELRMISYDAAKKFGEKPEVIKCWSCRYNIVKDEYTRCVFCQKEHDKYMEEKRKYWEELDKNDKE